MQLPKRVFPIPYQVDFTVESKGRHFDFSKRRLIWKFGFAHPPAVFPHLHDSDENYIGHASNDDGVISHSGDFKKGVECRGREHEIILSWSLLTGKAHLYVNSREIYRHQPIKDEIFNPFSASFHRGFDLPDSEFNGAHRIDIRCYARTPMGAKNMVVDDSGSKFRQYDLSVDGLSYFSMPAVFELGTESMWAKVSRWGLLRLDSESETVPHDGFKNAPKGRMVDEYYFDKSKQRSPYEAHTNGHAISKDEYNAISPRSKSEEERMMGIATNASLKEWEEQHSPPRKSSTDNSSSSSYERNHGTSNRQVKERNTAKQLPSIVEDNLIDFGVDDASKAMTQISIHRETASDVSVLDDDATTASFMVNTAWMSDRARTTPLQPVMSSNQLNPGQMYLNQQPQLQPQPRYHDPTYAQYAKQPWGSAGGIPSPQVTPRNAVGGMPPSDASFAVPPPPTWDDYRDAFGGSTTGVSVIGGYAGPTTNQAMSPISQASVGIASPLSQQWQSQQFVAQGGGGSVSVGGQSRGATQMTKSQFDPMRSDPFAF